ncbi:DUF3558 domain-containing protein [Tsukamurella strandjordii]|uniref:DUF3558 domain-containing protein n=1 Tax=Tsukamurella strandjordii TaxID=147577 RepID=A0AA90NBF7_9ACTN|nr:DUF3558 domain-containing protein [Tsukamurella strandjordii]MDP0398620.1 DUF3558 domain-containing protein [Tsukamurella strandjordii]
MRVLSFTLLTVVAGFLSCGCAVSVTGEPFAAETSRVSNKPLPFPSTIKNRTNDRNDGTSFEPCTAYTDSELLSLDINPATVEDAATVDSANYRGCHWQSTDYSAGGSGGNYSQIVGMKMPLDEYKRYMKTLQWQPDRSVQGRTIAIAAEFNACTAVFASDKAIVVTRRSSLNPSPGRTVECDRAFAFASLAVSKAP